MNEWMIDWAFVWMIKWMIDWMNEWIWWPSSDNNGLGLSCFGGGHGPGY